MGYVIFGLVMAGVGFFALGIAVHSAIIKPKIIAGKVIAQAAETDALTGLGNRYLFNKILPEMTTHLNKPFALCFLDLDDFKDINDNMGHDAGDELLIELGKRLSSSVANHGRVFRLGGDEYAIIIENVETKLEAEVIVKRIQQNVVQPISLRGNTINLEFSLGVSMFPDDTKDSKELINFADTAMYYVKERGKGDYYFHNVGLRAKMENKMKMEQELKDAVVNKEFGIDYQPRINMKSKNSLWFETFLYWNHPTIGKLKAAYFLQHAENIGLIIHLDEVILKDALKKIKMFADEGINNVNIAVNISLRHFQRKDFADSLCEILASHSFRPGSIMLQITDSIDVERIENYKDMFEKVRKLGAQISVSNFEMKYETMDMFKRLNIDEVKISAEYIASNSIFQENVLKDIITLAEDLDMSVVITKVDDENVLSKIVNYKNVDMLQGNYLHSMISSNELVDYVKKTSKARK